MKKLSYLIILILYFSSSQLSAQSIKTCRAELKNDTLVIENQLISRKFLWNSGNLITRSVTDKKRNQTWNWVSNDPDTSIPTHTKSESQGVFETKQIINQYNQNDHLEVSVTALMGTLQVKRIFQIYPHVAAISCTFYLRVKASPQWKQVTGIPPNAKDFNGIESHKSLNTLMEGMPVMDKLALAGNHWKLRPVEFFDMTDRNNTLVKENNYNLYRLPDFLTGNVLFIKNLIDDYSFFIVKEAPCSYLQLANVGFDFW